MQWEIDIPRYQATACGLYSDHMESLEYPMPYVVLKGSKETYRKKNKFNRKEFITSITFNLKRSYALIINQRNFEARLIRKFKNYSQIIQTTSERAFSAGLFLRKNSGWTSVRSIIITIKCNIRIWLAILLYNWSIDRRENSCKAVLNVKNALDLFRVEFLIEFETVGQSEKKT